MYQVSWQLHTMQRGCLHAARLLLSWPCRVGAVGATQDVKPWMHRAACLPQAPLRLIDAYYALGRFTDAAAALDAAVAHHPRFQQLPEYKVTGG